MKKDTTLSWDNLPENIRNAVVTNNLESLPPVDRITLYREICQQKGLDPATRPFEFIKLNGKLQMYARKEAADQLRERNNVAAEIVSAKTDDGVYVVHIRAKNNEGRVEDDIGATSLMEPEYYKDKNGVSQKNPRYNKPMEGLDKANQMMKAVTKGKRRVTLSICGLGMYDESEIEAIADKDKAKAPTVEEVEAISAKIMALREQYAKCPKKDKEAIMAQIVQLEEAIMDQPGSKHTPLAEKPPESTAPEKPAEKAKPADKPVPPEKPAAEVTPTPVEADPEEGAPGNDEFLADVDGSDWESHVLSGIPSKSMVGKKVSDIPLDTLEKIKANWIDKFEASIPDDAAKAKDAKCIICAISAKK